MMKRVERHRINPFSPFYAMLREFCHRSKNLYNHGNYLIRQTFIEDGKWLRYGEVDRLLKADAEYPDYREMPTAQTAQQTLRLLDKNWTFPAGADKSELQAQGRSHPFSSNLPRIHGKGHLRQSARSCVQAGTHHPAWW